MQVYFANFTATDIMTLLNHTGYLTTRDEFALAIDNELFKYIGCSEGKARYLVAFEDDNGVEGAMLASIVYVSIGCEGHLVCEYGGMPVFCTNSMDDMVKYFENKCN